MEQKSKVLKFEGCNFFRQRLVLSTLASKPVRITAIRENSEEPGLKGECRCGYNLEQLVLL